MKVEVQNFEIRSIDYLEWIPIQGALKDLKDENLDRLKKSFESKGGFVPTFVWIPNNSGPFWQEGLVYILDGHSRLELFKREEAVFVDQNGVESRKYPTIVIQADSLSDAKERLLAISSQFGQTTTAGFSEFIKGLSVDFVADVVKIDIPDMTGVFGGPDDYKFDPDREEEEDKDYSKGNGEIDTDDFEDKIELKLSFTFDQFQVVTDSLSAIDPDFSSALLKLLTEENEEE